LKVYRVTIVQELKPLDTQKRMAYCEWFMNVFGEDDELLDITWYSDEAWFHLSGYVNSQNTRIWATEHPHEIHEVPLHSEKTRVLCAISRRRIIGPIFFHETLNTARYLEIFNEFVDQLDDAELRNCYFQQDVATRHTSNESMAEIESFFDDRIISKALWPPRSPDLSLPNFFPVGRLKGKAYANKPRTIK